MEYNGGSVIAMVGKNCVAIASDLRLGNQALTVATNFEKVSGPLTQLYTGSLSVLGLPGDGQDLPWSSWTCNGCGHSVRVPSLLSCWLPC